MPLPQKIIFNQYKPTTMNKATELENIKKSIADLSEALVLAEKGGANALVINALKASINRLVDDYIATL